MTLPLEVTLEITLSLNLFPSSVRTTLSGSLSRDFGQLPSAPIGDEPVLHDKGRSRERYMSWALFSVETAPATWVEPSIVSL